MAPTGDPPEADRLEAAADGPVTGDPATILSRLPREAQLLLRDHIAGLEAQAGTARAAAERSERLRTGETDILLGKLIAARTERDDALRQVAELTERVLLLESVPQRRWTGR